MCGDACESARVPGGVRRQHEHGPVAYTCVRRRAVAPKPGVSHPGRDPFRLLTCLNGLPVHLILGRSWSRQWGQLQGTRPSRLRRGEPTVTRAAGQLSSRAPSFATLQDVLSYTIQNLLNLWDALSSAHNHPFPATRGLEYTQRRATNV